jgi:hypothetical protein
MLKQRDQKLDELLINLLADCPSLSAPELWKKTANRPRSYTIQAIYQELRKLQRQGVILKVGNKYSLKLAWVLEMISLADRMYDTHVEAAPLPQVLPEPNSSVSWRFSDVHRMDAAWTHLGLGLSRHSPDRSCFLWAPYAWFHLAHHADEEQFLRGMELSGAKYYVVIGSDTYLERRYVRFLRKSFCECSFAPGLFARPCSDYIMVAGDFVLTVRFDRESLESIAALMASVKSARDIQIGRIADVFKQPMKIGLKLENRPAKAAKLRKHFCEFFGVRKGGNV